jgi:hypothetical protein
MLNKLCPRHAALLAALVLSTSGLALLFQFLNAQAQPVASSPYIFDANLVVNGRDYNYPALTYALQITAPNDWEGWDVFMSFPHGTAAYTDSLDLFLQRLGVNYDPDAKPGNQVIGPMPASQPGQSTLYYTHTLSLRNLDQAITLSSPFQASLDRDELEIRFQPDDIPPYFSLHARIMLLGILADPSKRPKYGSYNDRTQFDNRPEAEINWDYPPDAERPTDSLWLTLPRVQFTRLSLGDYALSSARPVTVTTRLAVDASRIQSVYPALTSNLEIQAPRDWPHLSGLRLSSQNQMEYRDSLESFLKSIGFVGDQEIESLVSNVNWPPALKFDQRNAWLVLNSAQDTLYPGSGQIPFENPLGRLSTRVEGRQIVMELGKGYPPLYPWVSWSVELKIDGLQVLSARPMPSSDNGNGRLTWSFPAGSSPEAIRITTSLPTLLYLQTMGYGNAGWYWAFSVANFLLRSLFVLVLFGLLPSRRALLHEAYPADVRRVRRILTWSLVILLGVQLISASNYPFYLMINRLREGFTELPFWVNRLPDLFLPMALVIFAGYAAIEARRSRLVSWVVLALAGLLLVIFLPVSYFYLEPGTPKFQSNSAWLLASIPLYILLLLVLTAFVLVGIVTLFLALLPERSLAGFVQRARTSRRRFWGWLLVISIAILAQSLYLTTFAPRPGPMSTSLSSLFRHALDNQPFQPDEIYMAWMIVQNFQYYPTSFAYELAGLLPIFALAGVLGLIYLYGNQASSALFSPNQSWLKRLACLLFAGFIVSKNFSLAGMSIPLGFLAGWFILPRLLNRKLESSLEWIESHNPPSPDGAAPMITLHRREFILRAKAIEDLENQFGDLHSEYSKNKIDLETYESRRASLESEIEWLKSCALSGSNASSEANIDAQASAQGQPQPPTTTAKLKPQPLVRLPQGLSPKDLALSLGPGDNWWKNGLLAVRLGAIFATLPVGYYLYVLVTARARIMLATYTFGVFKLFQGLVDEAAFWLVAAFVMGLLYPYLWGRNGAIKGAFLALIYAIGMGLVALLQTLFGQGGGASWLFRLLQLVLYLVALGVLIDWFTLKEHHFYWKQILDHYNLQDTRTLVGYLSPLTLALLGLAQQILSGAASQSIVTEILKGITQALPNIP